MFQGVIPPDIHFLGFDLGTVDDKAEAKGDELVTAPNRQGWYFVFKEPLSEPRFGLDLKEITYSANGEPIPPDPPTTMANLAWNHLVDNYFSELVYIDLTSDKPDLSQVSDAIPWKIRDNANSADIAHTTFQKPFLVAIHGSDMLPA